MARDPAPDLETAGLSEPAAPAAVSTGLSGGSTNSVGNVRLRRGSAHAAPAPANAPLLSTTNLHAHTRIAGASTANNGSSPAPSVMTASASAAAAAALRRRRSSTFSDYSQDARDLLNPAPLGPAAAEALRQHQTTSKWDSLPLAFALLPAVGGLLVQGGSAFVTDLMLLGLGALFLHWSVTQPWAWYHSARQIREEHESQAELSMQGEFGAVLGEETDEDDVEEVEVDDRDQDGDHGQDEPPSTPTPLADVKEEDEDGAEAEVVEGGREQTETPAKTGAPRRPRALTPDERVAAYDKKQRARRQRERRRFQARQAAALRSLYRHEIVSLVACFGFPLLGAYLLHALRAQLTRPSEGLISGYNLTIFLLGAEVRPLRHLLQLVQARTLHLQRVVHANPFREEEEQYRARRAREEREQNQTLTDLVRRLDQLEAGVAAVAAPAPATDPATEEHPSSPSPSRRSAAAVADASKRDRDVLLRDLRAQLQPELDALARALRRTHKQQTLLEGQVAARFRATDQRLNSALASAAAGQAKTGGPGGGSTGSGVGGALLSGAPVDAFWMAVLWATETVLAVALYVARTGTSLAAAAMAVPLWPVQAIGGLFLPTGGGGSGAQDDDDDTSGSPTIVSGRIVKGGHGRTGKAGKAGKDGKHRLAKDGGGGNEYDYEYGGMLPSAASRNGQRHGTS